MRSLPRQQKELLVQVSLACINQWAVFGHVAPLIHNWTVNCPGVGKTEPSMLAGPHGRTMGVIHPGKGFFVHFRLVVGKVAPVHLHSNTLFCFSSSVHAHSLVLFW